MQILNTWRVITIGDGDLSFSLALTKRWPSAQVCASVLDSEHQIREKYQHNAIDELRGSGHQVLFNTDIMQPDLWHESIKRDFDVAIFQFPLVPHAGQRRPGKSWHQGHDANLLNRQLLRAFLLNSANYLLSEKGARLCFITSKDVKPYCDWNIECLGEPGPLQFLGKCLFNPNDFPGYRIRNVDRDKQVKSTAAITYIWTDKPTQDLPFELEFAQEHSSEFCPLCGAGPMTTEQAWQNHLNSRLHRRKAEYQANWEKYLNSST